MDVETITLPVRARKRRRTSMQGRVITAGRRITPGFVQVPRRFVGTMPEVKFLDTGISATISTTGAVIGTSLCLIPQGVTESTRVGHKATVVGLEILGEVVWQEQMSLATHRASCLRIVVVHDKKPNGANPTWLDLFELDTVRSPRNVANMKRFRILRDTRITPSNGVATTTDNWATAANTVVNCPRLKLFPFKRKLNIPLEFTSTAGAVTELAANNIVVMADSESGDGIHTAVLQCRLSYVG